MSDTTITLTGYNYVEHNIKKYIRGATFTGLIIEDVNSDRSLTGASITVVYSDTNADGEVLKTSTIGNGVTVLSEENKIFQIDPYDLDFTQYIVYYDAEIEYSDGFKRKPLFGVFNLKEDSKDG